MADLLPVAATGDEPDVLRAAHALEQTTQAWRRRPPLTSPSAEPEASR